jgi:hypothetical protein
LQHGLEQPALHRIVIDNEDGHLLVPSRLRCSTLCRFGSLCGRRLNGVLSGRRGYSVSRTLQT